MTFSVKSLHAIHVPVLGGWGGGVVSENNPNRRNNIPCEARVTLQDIEMCLAQETVILVMEAFVQCPLINIDED